MRDEYTKDPSEMDQQECWRSIEKLRERVAELEKLAHMMSLAADNATTHSKALQSDFTATRAEIVGLREAFGAAVSRIESLDFCADIYKTQLASTEKDYAGLVTVEAEELAELRKDKERLDWFKGRSGRMQLDTAQDVRADIDTARANQKEET